jgi:hypothetical protein
MHIVTIKIDIPSLERDDYGRPFGNATVKVPVIRLIRAMSTDKGLKLAKDTGEAAFGTTINAGEFKFTCDDGGLGRLWLFIRSEEERIPTPSVTFEVLSIESTTRGVTIV